MPAVTPNSYFLPLISAVLPESFTPKLLPFTETVISPVTAASCLAAFSASAFLSILRTPMVPSPFRNRMPLSLQLAAMKMFSSVIGSWLASSIATAALRPLAGLASLRSSGFSRVGSSLSCSAAIFTTSGSGSAGVWPK